MMNKATLLCKEHNFHGVYVVLRSVLFLQNIIFMEFMEF